MLDVEYCTRLSQYDDRRAAAANRTVLVLIDSLDQLNDEDHGDVNYELIGY